MKTPFDRLIESVMCGSEIKQHCSWKDEDEISTDGPNINQNKSLSAWSERADKIEELYPESNDFDGKYQKLVYHINEIKSALGKNPADTWALWYNTKLAANIFKKTQEFNEALENGPEDFVVKTLDLIRKVLRRKNPSDALKISLAKKLIRCVYTSKKFVASNIYTNDLNNHGYGGATEPNASRHIDFLNNYRRNRLIAREKEGKKISPMNTIPNRK